MKVKKKSKNLFTLFIAILLLTSASYAQENQVDSVQFTSLNKISRSYLLDDTYIVAGGLLSGIYFSNNFRDISFIPSYVFGIEQYYPLRGKVFLNAGVNVAERNFAHRPVEETITFKNLYVDVPLSASFELPVRRIDLRFILGTYGSYRVRTRIDGNYQSSLATDPQVFQYREEDFHRFDFGWLFGVSMEHHNFLLRFRSFSGFLKYSQQDQGMMSSFNLELGYFLFRR